VSKFDAFRANELVWKTIHADLPDLRSQVAALTAT
jgi:uncharacterized protein with HEPN domain